MKKLLSIFMGLLSLALPMSAAVDGKFQYSYPDTKDLPYNLGYQDLDILDTTWKLMYLNKQVKLAYNITSEENKTVEVVFDPSYMEIVDIVIPEKVIDPDTKKEYTVTAIGKMAFDDCPAIRSVIMPNSITRIEDYAFNMCENKVLHQIGFIKFSKNLTHIGNYAFRNCHNLTTGYYREGDQYELTVNNHVKSVDYPFYGYGGRLTGLDNYLLLPESVNYIGKHAFEGCYFEEGDNNHKNYGLCKVKIPNPSCVIDDYAFAGCEFLELVTIGEELNYDGLKYPNPTTDKKGRIGDYAFANCNLMRLDIPSSIESIGAHAFSNCFHRSRDLTPRTNEGRVYFDDLNWFFPRSLFHNESDTWHKWNFFRKDDSIGDKSFIELYDNYVNRWHTNTVTIHSNKTTIASNAFANNPRLEKVIINGSAGEIGSGAFRNCSKLTEVKLPDGLTKLSNSTFMNDSALVEINIPNDVTEIGDSAFYHCVKLGPLGLPSNLKKVNPYTFYGCKWLDLSTLPKSVTSIGNHAFYGCRNLTSFDIPDKVTTIGDYAFAECYQHESRREGDTLYGLTKVTIGNGVTSIGAHAFDGCRHLGTIVIGKNVKEIGDYAFQNCMSCPEEGCDAENNAVTLPDSLTTMGTGAFQGCTHLPNITLSTNITAIPDYAFAYCSKLTSVSISPNVNSISKSAFIGCYSLQDLAEILNEEGVEDGIYYEGNEVVSALPNITKANIKDGVTKIRDGAFANCGALESVKFPSTLKVIGSRAFANCGSLRGNDEKKTYMMFPNDLEEIGTRAFENCIGLTSAKLINVNMGEFVYAGCSGIKSVQISKDFTQDLQDNWFAGCIYMEGISVEDGNDRYSSDESDVLLLSKDGKTLLRAPSGITGIYIPKSVTTIGDYACSNCINLYEVVIPSTVTHIGAHAFDGCYYEEVDNVGHIKNSWGLGNVYLTNPAVTIDEYAFNNCKFLEGIYWDGDAEPGDMGSIGAYAFNNCEKLIFAAEELTYAVIDSIKPYAFANFPGIVDIELPETLVTIGDHAFDNCQNLTSVVFPSSLISIGNSAFKSSGLKAIYLQNTAIEEIGDSAFMDCSQAMALKLPTSLKKINPYTFYKCFSGGEFDEPPTTDFDLSVVIPDGVQSIGDYAFYGGAVNSKKYKGQSQHNTFSTDLYHYYKYGLSSVSIGDGVETIGAHAFDGCNHLLVVKMGNNVSSIGKYAFNNCFTESFLGVREVRCDKTGQFDGENEFDDFPIEWELASNDPSPITLPDNLKSLGEGAFNGCMKLPSINFPANLKVIPDMAFNGCKSLPKIELPEGITTIGASTFGGCTGVKEIRVPASLDEGSRAFVDCDNALTVYYYAKAPKTFDEAFFSPKVYSSEEAVLNAPNALIFDLKQTPPWASFHTIIGSDDKLVHDDKVLEKKNGLRFRVLSNKSTPPYCEVAGPVEGSTSSTYTIPETVKNIDKSSDYYGKEYTVIRIGNDAFENNENLTGITIPTTVFDIGQEAFNGCKNLAAIDLPESITSIGERAFAYCHALTFFKFPPKVTRVNVEVLRDCRGLLSVEMHDNIKELCMGALMDCRHLRKFERSENWKLELIDDYALKNCIELEVINIPEGVKKIGKEAMYYCQKLNTVSLPKSLLELGENTFDDCEVLATIKVYTETPPKMIGQRNLTDQHCKIYVQPKSLNAYKELWKVHEHRIEPGIIMTQPTRAQMPEYIPGNTSKISWNMPLEGQTMTWTSSNKVVATQNGGHDGTVKLNAVGRTQIKVETDQKFYHDCTLDVYPQLADANWDGRFDISDAVNIANYVVQNQGILNNWWKTNRKDFTREDVWCPLYTTVGADVNRDKLIDEVWHQFYNVGADVNRDNTISVADASAAVKEIFKQNTSARSTGDTPEEEEFDNADALVIGGVTADTSEGCTIPVTLDNSVEYVALQADIRVPEGMTLEDVKVGDRAAGHALSSRRIDDRTMRVVLFDLGNAAFSCSDSPVLELVVKGDRIDAQEIDATGVVASDISSRSYRITSRATGDSYGTGDVTGGDDGVTVTTTVEGLLIENANGKTINVYSLNGSLIRSIAAASGSELIPVQRGVYVVSVDKKSYKVAMTR